MNKKDKKTTATLLASILQGMANGEMKVVEIDIDPSRPIEDQIIEFGHKLGRTADADRKVVADILADPELPGGLKEHMKTCVHCQASYKEMQAEKATKGDEPKAEPARSVADETRDKLKAQHAQERKELAMKHDAQRAQLMEDLNKSVEPLPQAPNLLVKAGALRQFRHAENGGDTDGFVFGYDIDTADKIVDDLQGKIKQLAHQAEHELLRGAQPKVAPDVVFNGRPAPQLTLVGYVAFNEDNSPIIKSFRATREEVELDLIKFKEDPMVKLYSSHIRDLANVTIRPVFTRFGD